MKRFVLMAFIVCLFIGCSQPTTKTITEETVTKDSVTVNGESYELTSENDIYYVQLNDSCHLYITLYALAEEEDNEESSPHKFIKFIDSIETLEERQGLSDIFPRIYEYTLLEHDDDFGWMNVFVCYGSIALPENYRHQDVFCATIMRSDSVRQMIIY